MRPGIKPKVGGARGRFRLPSGGNILDRLSLRSREATEGDAASTAERVSGVKRDDIIDARLDAVSGDMQRGSGAQVRSGLMERPAPEKRVLKDDVVAYLTKMGLPAETIPNELLASDMSMIIMKPIKGESGEVSCHVWSEIPDSKGGSSYYEFTVTRDGTRVTQVLDSGAKPVIDASEVLVSRDKGFTTFRRGQTAQVEHTENPEGVAQSVIRDGLDDIVGGWRDAAADPAVKAARKKKAAQIVTWLGGGATTAGGLGYGVYKYFTSDSVPEGLTPDDGGGDVPPGIDPDQPVPDGTDRGRQRGADDNYPNSRLRDVYDAFDAFGLMNGLDPDVGMSTAMDLARDNTVRLSSKLAESLSHLSNAAWRRDVQHVLFARAANDAGRWLASFPADQRIDIVTMFVICLLLGDSRVLIDHEDDAILYRLITQRLAKPKDFAGSIAFPEAREISMAIASELLRD